MGLIGHDPRHRAWGLGLRDAHVVSLKPLKVPMATYMDSAAGDASERQRR